jgi:hypothetical protein
VEAATEFTSLAPDTVVVMLSITDEDAAPQAAMRRFAGIPGQGRQTIRDRQSGG